MTPLAAYADRLSVRPGETVRFHGSGAAGVTPHAAIHRVVCADPNPAIGGVQTTNTGAPLTAYELSPQRVPLGSFAEVGGAVGRLAQLEAFTVSMRVKCTRLPSGANASAIISSADGPDGGGASLVVALTSEGVISINGRDSSVRLPVGDWSLIAISVDRGAKEVALSAGLIDGPRVTVFQTADDVAFHPTAPLRFASSGHAATVPTFNGLLERPMIFDRVLTADEIVRVDRTATEREDGLVACWDFGRDMSSDRIVDIGPHALHGTLVNTPTRAVRGSRWTAREMNWRHAPDEYAAIHFHDDDVDDCAWPVVASFTVPDDFASGQYALMLEAEGATENVPFWVVPPKGRPTAKIAVLVSTFTYTVYGNHARPEWSMDPTWQQAWRDQTSAWGAYPHNPGDHADLGLSTYNTHTDGAGISIASWHRPMLNLRLGFLTYPYPDIRASGLRHYPTDTHLTMWLEAKGFAYDIITDWELHHEGRDLLAAYQVVLTGTHPEYHTREMLDALQDYRDGGGRFCYFGGNGFYWKIALSPTRDGVVEIRRAEGGIRAWAAEPGEYYNQFDGAYGGLWRRNGRPPQHLTGVGFSAQGNFVGSHYRLTAAARSSRARWIFEGIEGDTIGGHGFSGHGAAGFELDRADKALGTPAHAVILAQSEGHKPEAPWVLVPEERLTHLTTIPGASDEELIRADLTFFETAGGKGAVFSTGSITYCGSLPTNGFDNDISRLTENVVRRFLDPAPFPMDAA